MITSDRRGLGSLRLVAIVSCVYDLLIGLTLLFERDLLARVFGVPPPQPPIFVELNAVFLLAVGIGYLLPYRQPDRYRGYLWVMGPLLKGGGALALVVDHLVHASPRMFLLFAVTDGSLAIVTLWALLATRTPRGSRDGASTGRAESRQP